MNDNVERGAEGMGVQWSVEGGSYSETVLVCCFSYRQCCRPSAGRSSHFDPVIPANDAGLRRALRWNGIENGKPIQEQICALIEE